MRILRRAFLSLDILLTAAIAGFFYAYSSSVMIGLNAANPAVAIPAMQSINATIRNVIFAPSFFGPVLVGAVLLLTYLAPPRGPSMWLSMAGVAVYAAGGFFLTLTVNVPMNEALAVAALPLDPGEAARLWSDYSRTWTAWNHVRTFLSFVSLALLVAALMSEILGRPDP